MRVKREKSTTTKGHYLTNANLLAEVMKAKSLNRVTNELAEMLLLMAERYSRKSNFVGFSYRDDMISAALVNLRNNALKFNPEKSNNPFAYYTTAIHNSFLQYMADEKKHRNIRDALLVDAGSNPSFNFLEGEKDEVGFEVTESDEMVMQIVSSKNETIDEIVVDIDTNKKDQDDTNVASSKFRKDKTPSEVIKYSAKDVTLDEKGNLVFAPIEEKPALKKQATKKAAIKKPVKEAVKKPATKKAAVKKEVVKKPVAKKPAAKKPIAKKAAAKKPAAKKEAVKKEEKVTKKKSKVDVDKSSISATKATKSKKAA